MPISMTLSPTEQCFSRDGLILRAWRGTIGDEAKEVLALVAAVSTEAEIPGLTPIPPPDPAWSVATRQAMADIWKLAGQLAPQDASNLALLANLWIRDRARRAAR